MRWSIIRLIWVRELRDQLRDRRTIFMIAVLPLVLYPLLGTALWQFAALSAEKPTPLGIAGGEHLPEPALDPAGKPLRPRDYPPLLVQGQFPRAYFDNPLEAATLPVVLLDSDDPGPLQARRVDLLLTVPPDFLARLEAGERPELRLFGRDNDDRSRLASRRLYTVLGQWKRQLREVRLLRRDLPATYLDPFAVGDPEQDKPTSRLAEESMLALLVRIFPFMLVLWSLAGALYPAVDLCAGEKERGTMETLLISPASREEIVLGKFLAIWVFSVATALLNLASMGLTTWQLSGTLGHGLPLGALLWCAVLSFPTAAFFSAVCLAMGAYARSTKEGQYYLMPLFLVTMPLVFLTLAPGVELNPFYSMVPVTGVALLMQVLMTRELDQLPWRYFVPVLASIALYSWVALRWAIDQFKREEVLFREAERLDVRLWLRRLFREKEPTPSTGQALFCFALLLGLRWLAFGLGEDLDWTIRVAVGYLAFVATPPLMMVLLLTTRPRQGLLLRLPTLRAALAALVLAVLLLPPLSGLTVYVLEQFPILKQLLSERNPLTEELRSLGRGPLRQTLGWQYGLVLVLLPALCEELAFRGFILSGLRRRFQPWTAIVLSSFLFALYHMNVFQFLPAFFLGVVLGVLAVRTGSLLPGVVFHLMHNGLVIGLVWLEFWLGEQGHRLQDKPWAWTLWLIGGVLCTALAAVFLWRLSAFGYHRWQAEDAPLVATGREAATEVPDQVAR